MSNCLISEERDNQAKRRWSEPCVALSSLINWSVCPLRTEEISTSPLKSKKLDQKSKRIVKLTFPKNHLHLHCFFQKV